MDSFLWEIIGKNMGLEHGMPKGLDYKFLCVVVLLVQQRMFPSKKLMRVSEQSLTANALNQLRYLKAGTSQKPLTSTYGV